MVRAWSCATLISLLCLAMQCALKSSPALVVRSSIRPVGSASSCYAAMKPGTPLVPHVIDRRLVGAADVAIDIKFAGICHSDIHQVREEWAPGCFPMVPGHEIIGVVSSVGEAVTKFKVGDRVGVGCMVDSCRTCGCCRAGQENYCQNGAVLTYNDKNKYPHCAEYNEGGAPTYGGYAQHIVVDENYVCQIPASMDLSGAAPLLCAGITVYSPPSARVSSAVILSPCPTAGGHDTLLDHQRRAHLFGSAAAVRTLIAVPREKDLSMALSVPAVQYHICFVGHFFCWNSSVALNASSFWRMAWLKFNGICPTIFGKYSFGMPAFKLPLQ